MCTKQFWVWRYQNRNKVTLIKLQVKLYYMYIIIHLVSIKLENPPNSNYVKAQLVIEDFVHISGRCRISQRLQQELKVNFVDLNGH